MTEFIGELHSPLTQDEWDTIQDAELEHTKSITFHTPKGKQVRFINEDVLDEIKAEITEEETECPGSDDYFVGMKHGLKSACKIIDRHRAESEGT